MALASPSAQQAARTDALRRLTRLWTQRRTGVLVTDAGHVLMLRGEPRRGRDVSAIVSGLRSGDFRFQERRLGGADPVPSLGAVLLHEAARIADPDALAPGQVLNPTSGARFVSSLPLSQKAEEFLRLEGAIDDLIRMPLDARQEVKRELAAVVLLGFYKVVQGEDYEGVEQAWLRRELMRIQHTNADDHRGVLGARASASKADVAALAREKVERCLALQTHADEKVKRNALRVGGAIISAAKALAEDPA